MTGRERVWRLDLPSGIRLVCQPIRSVRSVAVGIWVQAGGVFESDSEAGVAHLLEHLMFKGTSRRNAREIARAVEGRGGHLGAFTEKELCCYYAVVLDDHLEVAIDVLSDIIVNHRFDDIQLDKEKGVVLEEISDLEDSPEEFAHELLSRGLWPDHPMGSSVLGTRASVSGLCRDTINRYWRDHYGPSTITVAVAGRIDPEALISMLEQHLVFSTNDAKISPIPVLTKAKPVTIVEKRPIGQVHVLVGARSNGILSATRFPLLVLNAALGGGWDRDCSRSSGRSMGWPTLSTRIFHKCEPPVY